MRTYENKAPGPCASTRSGSHALMNLMLPEDHVRYMPGKLEGEVAAPYNEPQRP
jgi:hypothetical protein